MGSAGPGVSTVAPARNRRPGRPGGLYWLVPELLLAFAGSILNAWILLVEIQR
jgi:hypothetical protein